jgi:transcriptional regulator with XRE-family HTH domain
VLLAGNLLRDARRAAQLTQAELADRLGTTQSVVARLESGRANPRIETLTRAIAATGHELQVSLEPAGFPSIDETLIASSLRREPAERLRYFTAAYRNTRRFAPTVRNPGGS